jgi:hypothetical protein
MADQSAANPLPVKKTIPIHNKKITLAFFITPP